MKQTSKLAQQWKALAAKSDALRSMARSYKVGENSLQQIILWPDVRALVKWNYFSASFLVSVLATFPVAVTKCQARSNWRKEAFILACVLEDPDPIWGRHDLGAYNSSSHHIHNQETYKRKCWYSGWLSHLFLFFLFFNLRIWDSSP